MDIFKEEYGSLVVSSILRAHTSAGPRSKFVACLLADSSVLDGHLGRQGHLQNVAGLDCFQVALTRKGSFALEIEPFELYYAREQIKRRWISQPSENVWEM